MHDINRVVDVANQAVGMTSKVVMTLLTK